MSSVPKNSFIRAIKSKVIIALLLACVALFMAWGVTKLAFKEMLGTVENIAAPSERLRRVNIISRKIGSLDQIQKNKAFNDPSNYRKLFKESSQLRTALDTLATLYTSDSLQLYRISTIKKLLTERDKQFMNYLKVRERLVNDESFSEQVGNLNDLVSRSSAQSDSTVLATVEKTSTTTIYPEEKPRSFFNKLFGRKKSEQNSSFRIVNEESVKRDTIALSTEEQLAASLKESLKIIEQQQQRKNASFLTREAILAEANNKLVMQMMDVLREVETEVVKQIEASNIQAKAVVNTSVSTMSTILLVFVALTGLLMYLILTDITRSNRYRTELEIARDEAEYHGRAKQRFLSNMSHEIRTPLQSIIGYAEMIKNQAHPKLKDIEAIYHSSEHLLQIVNEVLDYNRIISGKFTFSEKVFNMRKLLEEVMSAMRPQAERKSLQTIADFDIEEAVYVKGDPFRLKQILYNLLGNAIKFTDSGEISLSAFYKRKANNMHFTFIVRDTGVGIAEEEAERIFNEFEQSNDPDREASNAAGTGLGLTIIKSLVEQHNGGRIYLKSKPGEGSAFTVYLTLGSSTGPEQDFNISNDVIKIAGSVWVVDDDPLILDLCTIIFEKNEISYRAFNSAEQLLNAEWDASVKHILMDIRMPRMSGIELCSAMRNKVGKHVKIFAITAQVLPDERAFLLRSGFDALLIKPFREKELLNVLEGQEIESEDSVGEEVELDLSGLKQMTFGSEEQLRKVLLRFKDDSLDDSNQIRLAIHNQDLGQLQLITHRLAGRIAQIGARGLASEFRSLEIELRAVKSLDQIKDHSMAVILSKLADLLVQIDQELLRIT